MIIKEAYKVVEGLKSRTKNSSGPFWDYLSIKIKDNIFRIVFEYNQFYGNLIRQWSINLNTKSTVENKYIKGEMINFCCSNGLCGIREFEHGSIKWEFLLKPMGIKEEVFLKYKDENMECISQYKLKDLLKESDVEYKILYDSYY